jgi:threonine synthase
MLLCNACRKSFNEEDLLWRCSCGAPLSLDKLFSMNQYMIDNKCQGLWRYHKALPIEDATSVMKMGEQFTPLVKRFWNGNNIYFKYETLPTGSYKDRGVAVMLNRLRELGVKSVYEDSSGNAGASIAGYCAAADIPCEVMVPESTSRGKCVQIEAYGAALIKISGPRKATSEAAEERGANTCKKNENIYASHNWSPYFAHGVKTWMFETWEQLILATEGEVVPDAVVVPAGQGSLVLGAWYASNDLLRGDCIKKIPRIYAVQDSSCSPLYNAWTEGLNIVPDVPPPLGKCMAEGIVSTHIIRGAELLEAIRCSGGAVLTVDDEKTVDALLKLAKMGLYVEPTSAIAAAAIDELYSSESLLPGECVVVLLSSIGLKTTPYIQEILDGRKI